jgi:uncharacterized protein (DUF849 family)
MTLQKNNKVIITVAVTGAGGDKTKHPNLPITPGEIALSAIEAYNAGASVVHIHVKDPRTGEQSMEIELYREVVERIRAASDMIFNLTMGPGGRLSGDNSDPVRFGPETAWNSPERRSEHIVKLKPEICSLDVGTINMKDRIFANVFPHVQTMAKRAKEAGVKTELEVFELGHIEIAKSLIEKGLVLPLPLFQFCLGVQWGMPATPKNMLLMKEALPPDAIWGGLGVGASSFPMVAQSVLLGGNVRVGFEDNFNLSYGIPARCNAELVEKAVNIIKLLGKVPASPSETRRILRLVD